MGLRVKHWAIIALGPLFAMVCGATAFMPPHAQAQALTRLPPSTARTATPFILTNTPTAQTAPPTQAIPATPTPAPSQTRPPTSTPSATPPAASTKTPTLTTTLTQTPFSTPTPVKTETATSTPTLTATIPPTKTSAATETPTRTATLTQTPTDSPIIFIGPPPLPLISKTAAPTFFQPQAAPLEVIINEVAWGGAAASTADEWIELHNPGALPVSLIGWTLTSSDGAPSLTLTGTIPAGGYFLLERTDDTTVSDIPADQIYVGGLANGGETLTLRDELDNIIDTANGNGGAWPAGSGGPNFFSMERVSATADTDANWQDNNGIVRNGLDANGLPLNGTPKQANSGAPPTATPTLTPIPSTPYQIIINEVAWAGTLASGNDEWIELHNPTTASVDLSNWQLSDGGDISIILPVGFVVEPGGYRLLERTSDATVSDITADLIYTGGLNNAGETLTLYDAVGNVVDRANTAGGAWPAGDDAARASMERENIAPEGWRTHSGAQNGLDANGNFIRGTPRNLNSINLPTPTPFPYSTSILLNEFLPAPSVDGSEFIELINMGGAAVDISGWLLDDADGGSAPQTLPSGTTLGPGEIRAFNFNGLNNTGDTARLLWPDGRVADSYTYDDSDENISVARVPDGGGWTECGTPTPGAPNTVGACGGSGASRAPVVPIGEFRQYPAGAWATLTGRVTLPAPLFGRRIIYIQDETGGIALYLGRGDWPVLQLGQRVTVLGYSRLRSTGRLELYVRNMFLVGVSEPDGIMVAPRTITKTDETVAGQLVNMVGRVVRLESTAFWIDAGEGAVRVFFSSTTGVRRPKVRRGEIWSVIGIVTEQTATRTRAAGWQIQPRFLSDVQPLTGPLAPETTATLEPTPTEEPTATPEP